MTNKLLLHFSTYSFGGILIALAGMVSFPILTRVFTVEEYGVMNLVSITLTIVVGISKLGIHNSIVRYVHEVRNNHSNITNNELFNSVFFGMLFISFITSILWLVVSYFIPESYFNGNNIYPILLVVTALIPLRVIFSFFANTLKSLEKSAMLTSYKVIQRYLSLGLMLVVLFFMLKSLLGFYIAIVAAELVVVVVMCRHVFREFDLDVTEFKFEILRPMVKYGAPLMMYELSSAFLSTGDRYLIQFLIGTAEMGLYSAAYNLCEYVYTIFVVSVGSAILPMYMRIWEENGEIETKKFLNETLYYYMLLAVPIVFGFSVMGEDLINIMASNKYSESASIMPYVIAGMLIQGTVLIFAAGLYINKNTALLMWLVLSCVVINVLLNLVLIPLYGIDGAAISTLLSYIVLAAMGYYFGRNALSIKFPFVILFKTLLASSGMSLVIIQFSVSSSIPDFLLSVTLGALTYGVCMLFLDKNMRNITYKKIQRFI